jgi:anti-sigma regulatory factor (Ser/Thr protein kinase)
MKQTHHFSHEPQSVGAARRFATQALSDTPAEVLDAVELMVSELATNCIRYAGTTFAVTVAQADGEIRVEVTDQAGGTPTMRSSEPDALSGRGLQIVNLLAEAWGVEHRTATSTTVWFTVADVSPASPRSRDAEDARKPRRPSAAPRIMRRRAERGSDTPEGYVSPPLMSRGPILQSPGPSKRIPSGCSRTTGG